MANYPHPMDDTTGFELPVDEDPQRRQRRPPMADRLATVHDAFRDLLAAAEMAGWDIGDNKNTLDRAREGFATLVELHAGEVADDDGEPRCTGPKGHEWAYTGTQYGGDDDRWHGEGRSYCIHCGADGDA